MTTGPVSDGACALVLASAEKARRFGARAAWVAGVGNASDAYWTDRELSRADALRTAAQRAYKMAGIDDPKTAFPVAEISARSAYEEPLYAAALGFADDGADREWIERSNNTHGPVVNPSGGAITGNPTTVAGLTRVAEAYLQVTESAGEHQFEGVHTALAHGADGICGQSQSVVILRAGGA